MNRKLHSFFDPTIGADSPNGALDLEFDASNLPDLTDDTLKPERLERASTIPSSWYTHPSFHAFDRHSVFSTTWQYVGHESRIPEPGDYLSETVGGNPLIHPDLCDLLDYRSYVTEISPYYSLQYSPLKSGEHNPNAGSGDAFYFFVYPNFMMNILPGRLQINRVVATGYRSCRVIFDYYYD